MGTYRASRNIESSIIDKITSDLSSGGWTGIYVEKSAAEIYGGHYPAILINVQTLDPTKLEVGSKTWLKYYDIVIRIFAENDGQRLDLCEFITDKLEDDINYYVYTIVNGAVSTKVLTGRIVVLEILRNEKELTNTPELKEEDRYRHVITFRCYVATT